MGVINLNEQLKALEPQKVVIKKSGGINAYLSVVGKLVVLTVAVDAATSPTISVGTIPTQYRPAETIVGIAGNMTYRGIMTVLASTGAVQILNSTTTVNSYGQLIWTI